MNNKKKKSMTHTKKPATYTQSKEENISFTNHFHAVGSIMSQSSKETLKTIKSSYYKLIGPMTSDFFFIIIFIIVNNFFAMRIGDYLALFNLNLSKFADSAADELLVGSNIGDILNAHPEIVTPLFNALMVFLIMHVALFFIYCIFQSVSWFFSYQLSQRKLPFSRLLYRFLIINLPWFLIISLVNFFAFLLNLRSEILTKVSSEPISVVPNVIIVIIALLAFYFIIISYLTLDAKTIRSSFKKTFSYGFSHVTLFSASFFVIFLIFFILNFIDALISIFWLRLIFEVFVILAAISIARLYLLYVSDKLKKASISTTH